MHQAQAVSRGVTLLHPRFLRARPHSRVLPQLRPPQVTSHRSGPEGSRLGQSAYPCWGHVEGPRPARMIS